MNKETTKHQSSYDRIRVLATVCAIVTHTIQNDLDGFPSSAVPAASAVWVLAMVCNVLYVALSGALLYTWRDESPFTFYKKRLVRVVLPLWIYDLIVLAARAILQPGSQPVTFTEAILHLLTGQTPEAPQSWLVYLILSLYITVPFFRWMFKELSWKMLTGLIFLCMLFLSLQYAFSLFGQAFELRIFIPGWLFISFLGFWLAHPQTRKYAAPIILTGLCSGAAIAALCVSHTDQSWMSANLCNDTPLMILWGCGLFMLLQQMQHRKQPAGSLPSASASEQAPISQPAASIPQPALSQEQPRPESRMLLVLSRYSYSIILLHWAVMRYFLGTLFQMHAFDHGWVIGTTLCTLVNLGISLGFSIVIDALIIHPLQRLLLR